MVIAFVSTIRSPWGGSEELWAACADAALKENTVVISVVDSGSLSPKVNKLIERGARLDLRIGTIPPDLPAMDRLRKRLRRIYAKTLGNPFIGLLRYRPNIILYVGTAYSIAQDHKILSIVARTKASFFINVQLNTEEGSNVPTGRQRKVIRRGYAMAKGLFFVSKRNKEAAEKDIGISHTQAIVVRNPVNLDSTASMPMPEGEVKQLAMVGNLRLIHKGQDLALEALSGARWRERAWHLNIYGSGEDEQRVSGLVDFFKLENYVTFHGRVTDIREVWRKNHLLLMPSRMEGMPLAVVEAMVCGRPSVVTNVGGNTEWIEEGREGFIAGQATAGSFGDALERAWIAKEDWPGIGKNAHEKALKLYDPNAGQTLLQLLIQKSLEDILKIG